VHQSAKRKNNNGPKGGNLFERVRYGRLLSALFGGLPCKPGGFGGWVVDHKDPPIRVNLKGCRRVVADDRNLGTREWVRSGEHTAQSNRDRKKKVGRPVKGRNPPRKQT